MSRKNYRDYLYRTDREELAREQASRTALTNAGVPVLPGINLVEEQKKTTWQYFAYQIGRTARHRTYPSFVKEKDIAKAVEIKLEKKPKEGILAKINRMLGGQN